ncbi:MAG: magnesium transporter [Phycisphaerales bacterium]
MPEQDPTPTPASSTSTSTSATLAPDLQPIADAVERKDATACAQWLHHTDADDAVHALAALTDERRAALLTLLDPADAADTIELLPDSQAIDALEHIDPAAAAAIIEQLESDAQADIIKALEDDHAEAILAVLDHEDAAEIRQLAAYEEDTAGALMVTEYLAYPQDATVRDVLNDLQTNADRYKHYNIQYTYVTDQRHRLRGVIPMRNILLATPGTPVRSVMLSDPITVLDTMPLDELRSVFREYSFMGLPVVDQAGALLGVVERSDVVRAEADEAEDVYRASQGIVGGEELRSMPMLTRSRRRLAWLSINIVLNIIAASVIALNQDTLAAVIALAVFLPIISDMSGCSGNQAVAVSMRELTIGVTRPQDLARVLVKECSVGILNGVVLGILIGAVAYAWKGNIWLSAVVGAALAINTVIAVAIGGSVPLILKKFKTDPALASGPILTTITDMCGFFIVLTLASAVLSQLTGAM